MQGRLKSKLAQRAGLIVLATVVIISGIMAGNALYSPYRITGALQVSLPPDSEGLSVYEQARKTPGKKILVSTEDRRLWLISGRDTLLSAPVAVGMGTTFEYNGKRYVFKTPRGKRIIR